MNYIKVVWDHRHPNEPIILYSECDDDGWELRKVELFRDGHFGYASKTESVGGARLGIEPIPSIEDIAKQSEFKPIEISEEEFGHVWSKAQTDPPDVTARVGPREKGEP